MGYQSSVYCVQSKQLRWYGKVQPMTKDILPKQLLDCIPEGTRRRTEILEELE